jgi:hypothetical protein
MKSCPSIRRRALLCAGFAAAPGFARAAAPIAWMRPVEVAAGRGERGPWQQNASRYDFVDDPTVAFAEDGDALVAWVDQARKTVLLQRYAPDGAARFAAPVDVARSPASLSWLPRICMGGAGEVFVAWQEIVFTGGSHGGDIHFAASRDGGRSFEPVLDLSAASTGGDGKGRVTRDIWHNGSFDIVRDAGGALHVAWTEYDGLLWTTRSTDGGRRFAAARRLHVTGASRPARAPALAAGRDGAVALAWTYGEDAAADVHLCISRDGGDRFGTARAVARTPAYSDAPKLAFDAAGILHLVFAESGERPLAPHGLRYLRSRDGGATYETARDPSRPGPAAAFPSLCVGADGIVCVAWERYAPGRMSPQGIGCAVSFDGGTNFSAPQLVPGTAGEGFNGSTQGLLMRKAALHADGSVAIVNSSFAPGVRSSITLARGRIAR